MKGNPYVEGIRKKKPSIGPKIFQIDLTNNCNFNCLGCWCHSDLMGDMKFSSTEKQQFLPFDIIKKLVIDLAHLKTKRIILAGAGEPCLHPDIKEIISLIKSKGIELEIITNFSVISGSLLDTILKWKVEQLTISLWAGDAKTYVKTHPNQTEKTFYSIKRNLLYLNKQKNIYPLVRIYNVISKLNYDSISQMIRFAIDTYSDSVEFQVIDTVPDKTDSLRLTPEDIPRIEKEFKKAKKFKGYLQFKNHKRAVELQEFGRYVQNLPSKFNFTILNSGNHEAICPKGYHYVALTYDHDIEQSVLWFDPYLCETCSYKNKCPTNTIDGSLYVRFTSVLGYQSFMRRIKQEDNSYDSVAIDEIPCYVGYIYSKVRVNGDIVPCCKADKVPMGNLHKECFATIWSSNRYQLFRKRAAQLHNKHKYYFPKISCLKLCDNLGMNLQIIDELQKEKH